MRIASLLVLAACTAEPPPPPTPAVELQLPTEPYVENNTQRLIFDLDERLVLALEDGLLEVGADGSVLAPRVPAGASKLDVRAGRAAYFLGGASSLMLGRMGPAGVETWTEPGPPTGGWAAAAAAPDGAVYQDGRDQIWTWTTGAPTVSFTVEAGFVLMAADDAFLYGDQHGLIVQYARATGAREVLVTRGEYDSNSLVHFELRDQRIMYRVNGELFMFDLATRTTTTVGELPVEHDGDGEVVYDAAMSAFDATRSFYGPHRFTGALRERVLWAPAGYRVAFTAMLADQVAWIASPFTTTGPAFLYLLPADAPLE